MKTLAALLIPALLLVCPPAFAQDAGPPSASNTTTSTPGPTDGPKIVTTDRPASPLRPVQSTHPAHKFLDVKNSLAIAAFGAALAGDSYSTQLGLAYPQLREVNPVARPFVSSRAGEIAYSGASFALFGGGMYLAHRTGHHKLERMAPWIAAGWEGFLAGWNWHELALARSAR